ncbi:MAG: hypothetical protein MUO21_02100 [Nitrososphaeraceae archaeon]|nr:hypothetical protein [Nitrososphaeraceae archaeon]
MKSIIFVKIELIRFTVDSKVANEQLSHVAYVTNIINLHTNTMPQNDN